MQRSKPSARHMRIGKVSQRLPLKFHSLKALRSIEDAARDSLAPI